MRLLIVGGSDAGISAALRAREIAPELEVTVVLADDFPNFSICGLPFFLSGETPDWRQLAHRTEFHGIELLRRCTGRRILLRERKLAVEHEPGHIAELSYDRLVIATGARPALPAIEGVDLEGAYPLHTMQDSFQVHEHLDRGVKSAILIGSGYIGVEMADALTHRGIRTTLVGRSATVLPTVEAEIGRLLEAHLAERGVAVHTGHEVLAIERRGERLRVHANPDLRLDADLVILAAGVLPNTELAAESGIALGYRHAIHVNQRMETSDPNMYAAGDCAETWHRLLKRNLYLPLGTTSHKQGYIAGENAAGGERQFAGSVGTQVVKVFDLAVARTGLLAAEATQFGFTPASTSSLDFDHKAYYPGAREIRTILLGDRNTHQLLGANMIGHWQTGIARRIDVLAAALFHSAQVEELNDLDLSYTPPLGSPWDVIQSAAQRWSREAVARQWSREHIL